MFNNSDLDALAKKAKERLKKVNDEDKNDSDINDNDIYKNLREENETAESQANKQENVKIKHTPESNINNPKITYDPEDIPQSPNPTIDEYDKPIFPGGPSVTDVAMWKKQYEGYNVCAIEILEQYFVFRTLNRFEYKQLASMANLNPLQREEIICETCTLWPSNYDFKKMATDKAGIPSTYSQIIMEHSGFTKDYSIQIL